MATAKLKHCEACSSLIVHNSSYIVTIQDNVQRFNKYILCEDCAEALKDRIKNDSLVEDDFCDWD